LCAKMRDLCAWNKHKDPDSRSFRPNLVLMVEGASDLTSAAARAFQVVSAYPDLPLFRGHFLHLLLFGVIRNVDYKLCRDRKLLASVLRVKSRFQESNTATDRP